TLGFNIDKNSFEKYIEKKELLGEIFIKKTPPLFPKIEKPLIKEKKAKQDEKKDFENIISIDDFLKVSIKIGTVVDAQNVPKSKKLLKLKVDLNEDRPREIVAGIKEFYSPEDLINMQVCVVTNLKPAKLMGILSEGMILAAKDDEGLTLITPQKPKKSGTLVK
ncbi:MAG TPA: methionine--tRNA ligase subunit beta, partial [Campylobacterales bacterium]|nr:methionine--tRNA ligase subunit beta [Campylobacterales bacterium]